MMRGFRRAQLRGSDELFRSTQEAEDDPAVVPVNPRPEVRVVPAAPSPHSRSVRLTDDEIELLADALQRLKFPKPTARPPVHEHERFEELRRKLLNSL